MRAMRKEDHRKSENAFAKKIERDAAVATVVRKGVVVRRKRLLPALISHTLSLSLRS